VPNHHCSRARELGDSNALRGTRRMAAIVSLCGALASCACSSDPAPGAVATSGAAGSRVTVGGAGSGGSTAGSGASLGGTASGGTSSGGTAPGGAASGGASGGSGASAAGAPAAGSGGMTGTNVSGAAGLGGGAGAGGSSGASLIDCAGHALSLNANGTGTASDAAKAHVEIDMMGDLPIANAKRTFELWAYMKSSDWTANQNTLFFYGHLPSARNADGFGLDFGATSNSIGTIDPFTNAYFDNDNQASGVNATTAQWVHFAMTWDGTQVQAYVNGVLKSTKVSDNATQKVLKTGTSVVTLGGYPGENAYFADYVDELRVWSVARTAAELLAGKDKALVGNEPGLVGYWQFNESAGDITADKVTSAGHTAHVGTLTAASADQRPTFVVPNPRTPIQCP
jgi:concanavalin A-like lectin/glucanase superfamily protein